MDENAFVATDNPEWWLVQPFAPDRLEAVRHKVGEALACSDAKWYSDPSILRSLYSLIFTWSSGLLSEVDSVTGVDGQVEWLENALKVVQEHPVPPVRQPTESTSSVAPEVKSGTTSETVSATAPISGVVDAPPKRLLFAKSSPVDGEDHSKSESVVGDTPVPEVKDTKPRIFKNKDPKALTGEVNQFLTRHQKTDGTNVARTQIPVPDKHIPSREASKDWDKLSEEERKFLESGLKAAVEESKETLRSRLESEGMLLWTYSTDGLLSVGSPEENKHPVTGAGADVWAAGTVQLKRDEKVTVWLRYKDNLAKVERFAKMMDEVMDKSSKKYKELDENRKEYESESYKDLKLFLEEYKGDMSTIEDEVANTTNVVLLDFDSGHYTPSDAWEKTAEAWTALGYRIEKNPEGKFIK